MRLGMINSRVKDFYDLWTLAHERTFTGAILAAAIQATFTRRGTPLPAATPVALTEPFITDPAKLQLWHAFVSRNKLNPAAPTLASTSELPHAFLLPPTQSLLSGEPCDQQWTPGGPWQPSLFPITGTSADAE